VYGVRVTVVCEGDGWDVNEYDIPNEGSISIFKVGVSYCNVLL
jgi:hypothetical protein